MTRAKLEILIVLVLVAAIGVIGFSATAQTKKYEISKEDSLEIQLAVRDTQLAQMQLQEAQRDFEAKRASLNSKISMVRDTHKWPVTVQYNLQTNEFEDTVPQKAAAPEPKK